ncbi:MAG: cysteine--tRNA ligase [Alphaproteobacteria bacterium]
MSLTLHNSATRRKEVFKPLDPANVGIYACGPTVYDLAHVGNARMMVAFDLIVRVLRDAFPKVTYVRNITDVDDKINAAANAQALSIEVVTERTTRAMHEDMGALGVLPPDVEPTATAHIAQMIAMIEVLIARGHAYVAENHVLFSVESMPAYGRFSGRDRDAQVAGARVDVAPYKRDPADFVLWKPSDGDQPGWDSPWGRGRPGWHIECSAMSEAYLGATFDIHGGGADLIFPHHENEVAQSVCAHGGAPLANYWLHNGMVMIEGQKMSKSLGNFVVVRDALERWKGEEIRWLLLSAHYRQPLDWTESGLRQARANLDRLYSALRRLGAIAPGQRPDDALAQVRAALRDDFNTPMALSELMAIVGRLNRAEDRTEQASLAAAIVKAGELLGVAQVDPEGWFKAGADEGIGDDIDGLIAARTAARGRKDFAESDRIRDTLLARGVVLEDGPGGTTWRYQADD